MTTRASGGPAPRPLRWPRADAAGPEGPSPRPPEARWLTAAAFAGILGPETTRRLGTRVSFRPTASTPADLVLVAEAKTPAGLVRLGLDRPTAALALERIFGAPDLIPPEPPERLADLVPASASWETLTTLLAEAMAPALAEAGLPPTEPPVPASRLGPLDLAGPVESQGFALELGGRPGHLALTLAPAAPAGRAATADGPATAAPEPQHGPPASDPWQARIARLARQIELPIGLRIAELRLPVETVARLEVGSLIPIARPRLLMLSVDGVPWRRVAHPHDTGSGGAQP